MSNGDSINCQEMRDLIPAYALGALDEAERAQVERALPACPELRAELKDYQALADRLSFSAPPATPPPAVLGRILSATATPVTAPGPRRWQWVALAATMGFIFLFSNLFWIVQIEQMRAGSQGHAADLLQFLGMGPPVRAELGATGDGETNAVLVWVRGETEDTWVAWFVARQFPEAPPGSAYQIWLNRPDGRRISPGVFTVDAEGSGALVFTIAEPLEDFESVGVTAEPMGGSPGPTTDPIVRGDL